VASQLTNAIWSRIRDTYFGTGKGESLTTRSFFNRIAQNDPQKLADSIFKSIYDEVERAYKFRPREEEIRVSYRCSVIRNSTAKTWILRNEEALERLIVLANEGILFNQYPLEVEGVRDRIDLVQARGRDPETIIELKDTDSMDSPLLALVEVMKNCALVARSLVDRHPGEPKRLKGMMILAPVGYWRRWNMAPEERSDTKAFIHQIASRLEALAENKVGYHIHLSLMSIDLRIDSVWEWIKNQYPGNGSSLEASLAWKSPNEPKTLYRQVADLDLKLNCPWLHGAAMEKLRMENFDQV
jgi:hypothetical protein